MLMMNEVREDLVLNLAHITSIEFAHTTKCVMTVTMNNGESFVINVESKTEGLKRCGIGPVSKLVQPGSQMLPQ